MPLLTLYFQLHQPFRLHPERDKFIWEEMNREVFLKTASTCYLPAIRLFEELIETEKHFKITLGMSGTFLEQADRYEPGVILALQRLVDAGKEGMRVEFLDETYYHSLSNLFDDPKKQEFRDQISLHRDTLRQFFGIRPSAFRNTELMYSSSIAEAVADMGYRVMLCEWRKNGTSIPVDRVYRAEQSNLIALVRNRRLSEDVALRFSGKVSPESYAKDIADINGELVLLGYNFEHIGEHFREEEGIFAFWKKLPRAIAEYKSIEMANPAEIADKYKDAVCPVVSVQKSNDFSQVDAMDETFGWVGSITQYELFKNIESLEDKARKAGGELLTRWRHLTASDHVYFLREKEMTPVVHTFFNPYGGSVTQAAHVLTRKIDGLESALARFEILKKSERTAVLIIAPESGRLPDDMGPLARYISGKSGGLGEVVSALCEGLNERNIDVHLATLNLKKRFQMESQIDEDAWREIRYHIDPGRIHLVTSAVFADLPGAYAGNTALNAAEFQKEIIHNIIKDVSARSRGKLIVHSHDWMAGGAVSAYVKSRGFPMLHTLHNSFTGHVPLDMFFGLDIGELSGYLYYSSDQGRPSIDCQATAIKNATLINFVGQRFLEEVVNDYFTEHNFIPYSIRQEVKQKYFFGSALAIINAPARSMYPENCEYLVRKYGVDDDFLTAKKENLMEFQKRMGLKEDPAAILFYWPSRLDPVQKGIDLLESILLKFAIEHWDVQFAIVANGVGGDRYHEEVLGRISWVSGGKIAYHHYREDLSMLGFAAAADVFGASLYEPCGQIDQVGNLFGATATNRDTGGYHDKIRELRLRADGSPQDVGNGFLFRDYDPGGLVYGLEKSLQFHRKPSEVKESQIRRIMKETRQKYDLGNMIAKYIGTYERLNGGKPLV
ncbi:MAG: glycogen/starch synthase [Syntrophales bacterium]|jgi:glycogen synthase|nr:glycogen/starch synthase [Syntrophales bacterium]MDY0043802.1 glycogen/starch synthase [Syntrophales bacterium]